MKKVKNVIVVYDYAYINGGAAKVAIQSAVGLAEMGFNVVFFSAIGPIEPSLQSKVQVVCLNQKDLISNNSKIKGVLQGLWNSKAKKVFENLLKEYDPDETIIHFHGWIKALSSSVFSVVKNKNYKVFLTLHDYFVTCPNGGFYNYKKKCICKLKPLCLKCICSGCDKRNYVQKLYRVLRQIIQNRFVKNNTKINYIYISEKNYEVAKQWMPSNAKFLKVTNPIELNSFQYEQTDNKMYIYIGRVSYEKGVDIFCEAISRLNLDGVVIGDGELKNELSEKYKDIQFVGWLSHDKIIEYLKDAKALIFPSRWYEGAPLTVVEVLSEGIPCVVSDCSSAVEVIEDGKNGLIFLSDNVDDLCNKIQSLTPEKASQMQHYIRKNFNENTYSLSNHLSNLVSCYENNGN